MRKIASVVVAAVAALVLAPGVVVGQTCSAVRPCGDVNDSGAVTSSDALSVLRKAVGQPGQLICECSSDAEGECAGDLVECESSLGVCVEKAALCGDTLSVVTGDLSACDAERTTCQGLLAVCGPPSCGDDAAGCGEACDGADLNGKTCATEAPAKPYGTLACSATCDAFDTSGCKGRFTDNGNGTVTDSLTKLMWERKTTAVNSGPDSSDPHDVDNVHDWTALAAAPTGNAFSEFLASLNGALDGSCFAGYCDWRLPTLEELQGIVSLGAPGCGTGSPCIDAIFGPTQSSNYWSSTTAEFFPSYAWFVLFDSGGEFADRKTYDFYVRAVRTGS